MLISWLAMIPSPRGRGNAEYYAGRRVEVRIVTAPGAGYIDDAARRKESN
jgi:hypothetical protein